MKTKKLSPRKLSPRMIKALKFMAQYGDYELLELQYWNTWQPINRYTLAHPIRTDTMKGLINRGLVQEEHGNKRHPRWTASLTKNGKDYVEHL